MSGCRRRHDPPTSQQGNRRRQTLPPDRCCPLVGQFEYRGVVHPRRVVLQHQLVDAGVGTIRLHHNKVTVDGRLCPRPGSAPWWVSLSTEAWYIRTASCFSISEWTQASACSAYMSQQLKAIQGVYISSLTPNQFLGDFHELSRAHF